MNAQSTTAALVSFDQRAAQVTDAWLNRRQLLQLAGCSQMTLKKWLAELEASGIARQVGSGPKARWEYPAAEAIRLVRRRLFVEPSATARTEIAAVARQFVTFYRENHGQFPSESEGSTYEDRIKAAYPIHPELFDRLYTDWSTLERFQRTRGVLRLMSTVIHELWSSGDASPLIMPGSVPLHAPRVASELTNYLPDSWKPIIDKDIDGEGATPVLIDAERTAFGSRALTRRIARTIFVESAATLGTEHKGVERPRLWLGVAIPGDTVGNFGASLEVLSQRATYLYTEDARYWFGTTASVTRTAADIADRLREEPERVWDEIKLRLPDLVRDRGLFTGVHNAPPDDGDVPDTDTVRLVVVHPRYRHARGDETSTAWQWVQGALLHAGSAQRRFRNQVVFLAADAARYEDLDAAARDFLAWKQVDEAATTLNLTSQQAAQAASRRRQSDEDVRNRLLATYTALLVPVQPRPTEPPGLRADRLPESGAGLAVRVSEKLRRGDELTDTYGALGVRMALDGPLASVWTSGHVSVGELWSLYAQYPYLHRLRDRSVLERALLAALSSLVWQVEGFALAEGYDEGTGRYLGLVVPGDQPEPMSLSDSWLVVRPEVATAQRAAETAVPAPEPEPTLPGTGSTTPGTASATATTGAGPVLTPRDAAPTRFFGSVTVSPERYGRDLARIAQDVVAHLAAAPGTTLEVSVEVHATNPAGFATDTVRTVRENAATLKFDTSGFEAE